MKRLALALVAVVIAATLVATAVTFASDEPTGTTIEHDGDRMTLAAGPDQEVAGQTDLEPGTTLQLRLTSTDAAEPFLMSRQATVEDDGSFTATFDVQDVSEGATGNLTVSHDDSLLTSASVEVVACEDDCEPADEATDEPTERPGTTVHRDGETLTLTGGAEQEITGRSDLGPGTELHLTLQSTDPTQPLLLREEATVTDDGAFTATMDLDSVSEETNASLTVSHDDEEMAKTAVTIEPCEDDCGERTASSDGESAVRDEFGLEEDVVVATRDETAEIPVAFGDADAATLRIGGDDVNYRVTATARDGNGDGRVVFEFDPSAAGSDEQTVAVRDDGDSVSIGSETGLDDPLDPAEYELSLYRGTATDGDVAAVGTLSLQNS